MTTSGLFRVDLQEKTLDQVEEIDLASLGLKERYDLQEWIDKKPEILGEELLVIAKECNSFDSTSERADLIALDKLGNLVVIELKRDDSGTNVHWQAIKYASYFARAKPDVLVELLAKYAQLSIEDALIRSLAMPLRAHRLLLTARAHRRSRRRQRRRRPGRLASTTLPN